MLTASILVSLQPDLKYIWGLEGLYIGFVTCTSLLRSVYGQLELCDGLHFLMNQWCCIVHSVIVLACCQCIVQEQRYCGKMYPGVVTEGRFCTPVRKVFQVYPSSQTQSCSQEILSSMLKISKYSILMAGSSQLRILQEPGSMLSRLVSSDLNSTVDEQVAFQFILSSAALYWQREHKRRRARIRQMIPTVLLCRMDSGFELCKLAFVRTSPGGRELYVTLQLDNFEQSRRHWPFAGPEFIEYLFLVL